MAPPTARSRVPGAGLPTGEVRTVEVSAAAR
jgi:hypothetical protein